MFNIHAIVQNPSVDEQLAVISQREAVLLSICGNDQNLMNEMKFKISADKLKVYHEEIIKFVVQNSTENDKINLSFYELVLHYIKESCIEESTNSLLKSFGKEADTYALSFSYQAKSLLSKFIKENSLIDSNHWFLKFVCSCEDLACLKAKQRKLSMFIYGDEEDCYGHLVCQTPKITLDVVDYFINELKEFLSSLQEKRSRGSVSTTQYPERSSFGKMSNVRQSNERSSMRGSTRASRRSNETN